jgi:putative chitinase
LPARAAALASHADFILPKYGIDSPDILHEFIANVAHESGAFRLKEENLNYKNPARLVAIWPSRFTTMEKIRSLKLAVSIADIVKRKVLIPQLEKEQGKASAEAYAGEPRKIANLVYGSRMGNHLPDDGWNMRGGGFAQLTGREMYEAYRRWTGHKTTESVAECVRTDDWWAMDSAAWFFSKAKGLVSLSKGSANLPAIVTRWNGGLIGWTERQYYYERAKTYIY